jgi:hypothetical protein
VLGQAEVPSWKEALGTYYATNSLLGNSFCANCVV